MTGRASLFIVALGLLTAPLLRSGPPPPVPRIVSPRPIQIDYPEDTAREGGSVVAVWKIEGSFDEIHVEVDRGVLTRALAPTETSTSLGVLPEGKHVVEVQGLLLGEVISRAEEEIEVLHSPPLLSVEDDGCLFYAYVEGEGGFLELFWKNRDVPAIPYFDFEISVNGIFQGVLPAPASGFRFRGVDLGAYGVEVVAYTRNHLCGATVIACLGEEVADPFNAVCELVRCEGEQGLFQLRYELAPGPPIDGVGVFDVTPGGPAKVLGTFPPGPPVPLPAVDAGKQLWLEIVALRGDSASTVPPADGEHTITVCSVPAAGCVDEPPIRRGECNGDGRLDISDPVVHLSHLFIGGDPPPCSDACDANDDGREDITDPIVVLSFLFTGGIAPPEPFPACGSDPTADSLSCARAGSCP